MGAHDRTYSSAPWQPEKDLPRQQTGAEFQQLMSEKDIQTLAITPLIQWVCKTSVHPCHTHENRLFSIVITNLRE